MSQPQDPHGAPGTGGPETDAAVYAALRAPAPAPRRAPSARWQGWAWFAGGMMGILGLFWAMLGLVALVDRSYFTLRENRLLALQSYSAGGWVHLLGGLLALAAGIGILWGGRRWSRRLGIVVAALAAVVNMGFLAASPVWSTLVIAVSVLAIHALTVHGEEIEAG